MIKTLHDQQEEMYEQNNHTVKDRIVSISQPHVRPIVRGKVKTPTDLGAKFSINLIDGYAFIENLSCNNYHEGDTFIPAVEAYKEKKGYYPLVVGADAVYRNRDNLRYCNNHGIRLSSPRLDSRKRNAIEGAFGVAKRCYGLNLVMAKLKNTSETVIALQF